MRNGCKSHCASLCLQYYIKENILAESEIIDLREYKSPVFDDRSRLQKNLTEMMIKFADNPNFSDETAWSARFKFFFQEIFHRWVAITIV